MLKLAIPVILLLTTVQASAETKVIALFEQEYYEPGSGVDITFIYYDEDGLSDGVLTTVIINDPRGEVMEKMQFKPSGFMYTHTYTIPEGEPPKFDEVWFGRWSIEAYAEDFKFSGNFEVRRSVGKRYYEGLYAIEYGSRDDDLQSIVVSPTRNIFVENEGFELPITMINGTKPYHGVAMLRLYKSGNLIEDEIKFIDKSDNGKWNPELNLEKGVYLAVVDTFANDKRQTQMKAISIAPAVVLMPSNRVDREYHVIFLDPVTYLPVEGALVTIQTKDSEEIQRELLNKIKEEENTLLQGDISEPEINEISEEIKSLNQKLEEIRRSEVQTKKTDEFGDCAFPENTIPQGTFTIKYMLPNDDEGEILAYGAKEYEYNWLDITLQVDRPIYAPGQAVNFRGYTWGISSEVKPVNTSLVVKLRDPEGFILLEQKLHSNNHGIFNGSIILPMNIDPGDYTVECRKEEYSDWHYGYGSQRITVKHFEREQLITGIFTSDRSYDHGDMVSGNVSVRYYFGKPSAGSEVLLDVWWASTSPGGYYVPYYGYEGYDEYLGTRIGAYPQFGDNYYPEHNLVRLERYKILNLTTDKDGIASFNFSLGYLRGTHIIAYANITDPAGRKETISTNVRLAPSLTVDFDANYSTDEILNIKGNITAFKEDIIEELSAEIVGLLPAGYNNEEKIKNIGLELGDDGKFAANTEIQKSTALKYTHLRIKITAVDRYERKWTAYRDADTGKYTVKFDVRRDGDSVVGDIEFIDNLEGKVVPPKDFSWGFSGPDDRSAVYHNINYRDHKFSGRDTIKIPVNHYPSGSYKFTINSGNYNFRKTVTRDVNIGRAHNVSVYAEKEEIEAGETAKFNYRFDGFDRDVYVVLQEYDRSGLMDTHVTRVSPGKGYTHLIETTEDMVGSVSLTAFTLAENGICYGGGNHTEIKVKGLKTRIYFENRTYKPGEKLEYKIEVTDKEGSAVQNAALGLVIADKSVLDIKEMYEGTPFVQNYWSVYEYPFVYASSNIEAWSLDGLWRYDLGLSKYKPIVYSSMSCVPWGYAYYYGGGGGYAAPPMGVAKMAAGEGDTMIYDMEESALAAGGAISLTGGEVEDILAGTQTRTLFPETALWEPFVVTDEDGVYTGELTLPDTLTTWNFRVYASTKDCEYAENETAFVTRKDFFIEPYIPAYITQGDNTSLSLTAHNYLNRSLMTIIGIKQEDWFDLYTPNAYEFEIMPDVPFGYMWHLRARDPFYNNVTFFAVGGDEKENMSDAVTRDIWVRPNGVEWDEKFSGETEEESVTYHLFIPDEAYDISIRGYANFGSESLPIYRNYAYRPYSSYPNTEQTVSEIIPYVLRYEYMEKLKVNYWNCKPCIEQPMMRLLFLRHEDGGWGWKKGPSTPYMTSYALRGLYTAKKTVYVNDAYISDAVTWLEKSQNEDGSWNATDWLTGNDPGMTALVARNMQIAGHGESGAVKKAIDYLNKKWGDGEIKDPYTIAVYALILEDSGDDEDLESVLGALKDMKKEDEEQEYVYWSRGYSLGGPDETTALAALALLKSDDEEDIKIAKKSLKWLREDNPWEFTTPVDMISALDAHLALIEIEPPVIPDMNIDLYVNDKKVDSVHLFGIRGDADKMRLTDYLHKGENTIKIVRSGEGKLMYDLWFEAYLGGKIKGEISQQPEINGIIPVMIRLTPETDAAVPARIKIELPRSEGYVIVPSPGVYIPYLNETQEFIVYYAPTTSDPGGFSANAGCEYQLSYNNKIEGLQFDTFNVSIDAAGGMEITDDMLFVKRVDMEGNVENGSLVELSVTNNGRERDVEIHDFIPPGLRAGEYGDAEYKDNKLVWKLRIRQGEEVMKRYIVKGGAGRYDLGRGIVTADKTYVLSNAAETTLYSDDIVVTREFSDNIIAQGDSTEVDIAVTSKSRHYFTVIEEPIPPGFTIVNYQSPNGTLNVIVQGDKIVWFLNGLSDKRLSYTLKADAEGKVHAPPTVVYPMYQPEYKAYSREEILSVGKISASIDFSEIENKFKINVKNKGERIDAEITVRIFLDTRVINDDVIKKTIDTGITTFEVSPSGGWDRIEAYINAENETIGPFVMESEAKGQETPTSRDTEEVHDTGMPYELFIYIVGSVAVLLLAAVFAIFLSRRKDKGSGRLIIAVFVMSAVLLVAGYGTLQCTSTPAPVPDAAQDALQQADIHEKPLFIYPQVSVVGYVPKGDLVDYKWQVHLNVINRMEEPREQLTLYLDQPLDYTYHTNTDEIDVEQVPASSGTKLLVRFKNDIHIAESISATIYLSGKTKLSDLETNIKPGFETDGFFTNHGVDLELQRGLELKNSTLKPAYEYRDKWNPDRISWFNSTGFCDALHFDVDIKADPLSIEELEITDIMERSLDRTRTWSITYQNIGDKSISRLPLDVGANAKILTDGAKFSLGEVVLDKPLPGHSTITITAEQKYSYLGKEAAYVETTMDEIKRATAPAKSYKVHVEIHGLTVENKNGFWDEHERGEKGKIIYDRTEDYPFNYYVEVVT